MKSAQALGNAWALHFELGGPAPSTDWIERVAAEQRERDAALQAAKTLRAALRAPGEEERTVHGPSDDAGPIALAAEAGSTRPHRRRRSWQQRLLRKTGSRGKKWLHRIFTALSFLFALCAAAIAFSVILDYFSEDLSPLPLSFAAQAAIFIASCWLSSGFWRLRKSVGKDHLPAGHRAGLGSGSATGIGL